MASGADRAVERPRFSGFPFSLGVASGAPLPDGVVLWTRLAPEPLRGGGAGDEPVAVRWEVADDGSFARVVRCGSATARPAGAFSVHVEVSGLQPARWYFYRVHGGGRGESRGTRPEFPRATRGRLSRGCAPQLCL